MGVSLDEARAHQRRLDDARRERGARRGRALSARLGAAARLLAEEFGASEVIVFGSLARGDVSPRSDVDIAVRGLPSQRYFDALAELMRLFGAPVDLVRLEEAPASLRDRVAAEGRRL